jgi:hypothetical protein
MDERAESVPTCSKCKTPTGLHSIQIVSTPGGEERMNVFRCDGCGRLDARSSRSHEFAATKRRILNAFRL